MLFVLAYMVGVFTAVFAGLVCGISCIMVRYFLLMACKVLTA